MRGQGADGEKTEKGGDLLVTIDVRRARPISTSAQRAAVEALAAAFPDDPRAALFEKQHNRRSSDG